jgi:hypothetical protein
VGQKNVHFCPAQPKRQVKDSLKAELALILISPATHPPVTPNNPGQVYFAACMHYVVAKH